MKSTLCFGVAACALSASLIAGDCSDYRAISSVATDDWCQSVACGQYCVKSESEADCMRMTYKESLNICDAKSGDSESSVASDSAAHRRVIYIDWKYEDLPATIIRAAEEGFTHVVLGFWIHRHSSTGEGPRFWDAAAVWADLPSETKDQVLASLHSKGAKLILSVGGGTENHGFFADAGSPTGTEYGMAAGQKVLEGRFDGVDLDSENWRSDHFSSGAAVRWLIDVTRALRNTMGENLELTHAPQAPYFSPAWSSGNGYRELHNAVGDLIDFYFIQYYNQGDCSYATYDSLFVSSGSWCDGSAVNQIISSGIPADKIVIGKFSNNPASANGSTGYLSPTSLYEFMCRAGFTGGAGLWQWDPQATDVLQFSQSMSSPCP